MIVPKLELAVVALCAGLSAADKIVTDPSKINRSWGQLSVYEDNADDYFGIDHIGLPDGCQVESVSTLQRHAQRFAIGDTGTFAQKLSNFTKQHSGSSSVFTGPLEFFNSYSYVMADTGLLTGIGARTEFNNGVNFWNRYGRTLFDAPAGQQSYSAAFPNGTARPKVTLRTTDQSRIENTQINWALGFFGPSYNATPDHTLEDWNSVFNLTEIHEGGTENNTLASYDSCFNDNRQDILDLANNHVSNYTKMYLKSAAERLQKYAPKDFNITYEDAFNMQNICAYEYAFIGMSDFCNLFTEKEWLGFENALDIEYYFGYSYGNPTGRAQGIGYVQELIARLKHEYILSSNSSVNSTLDNNDRTFPLGQKIYPDFSHDDIIISVLTALSVDYFKDAPTLTKYPPQKDRRFNLAYLTPFGANLVTEQIGCSVPNPESVKNHRVAYTPTQYGYNAANATHKFIRMRLNNGIVPLHTIRGGACGDDKTGRKDGLCELGAFFKSQETAYELSNYNYACFANYTIPDSVKAIDYDGTIVKGKTYN